MTQPATNVGHQPRERGPGQGTPLLGRSYRAAAVFAACFFLIKFLAGTPVAVLTAGVSATLVLALEGSLGVMLLGWLFERFDVSTEQT